MSYRQDDAIDAQFDDERPLAQAQDMGGGPSGVIAQGMTLARTQVGYTTAIQVQKPRALDQLTKRVSLEAGMAGESFFYSWTVNDKRSPTGKSLVEGMSIDGAMILARNWGNCAIPVELVEESSTHWIMKATFVDLETGYNMMRLYRQRKAESHGRFDNERALDIAFQIGQSKAIRNVVRASMPEWLIDRAMRQAKKSAQDVWLDRDKDGRPIAGKLRLDLVERAVAGFAKMGIGQELLERKVGEKRAAWTAANMTTLAAIKRAIDDGTTTAEQEFDVAKPEEKPATEPQPTQQAETRTETRTEQVKAAAERAVNGDTAPPATTPKEPESTQPKPPPSATTASAAANDDRPAATAIPAPQVPNGSRGRPKPALREPGED